MKYSAKKAFSSIQHGNVKQGQPLELSVSVARQMYDQGLIDIPEGIDLDFLESGEEKRPLSSPAAPASTKSKDSKSKQSNKAPAAKPSQSTQVSEPSDTQMPSTPVTGAGGSNTTKKRQNSRKNGPKTSGRQKGTD
jgi:hypothetical protein